MSIIKKLLLQAFLLVVIIALVWLYAWGITSQDQLFTAGVYFSYLFNYLLLSLFVFIPVSALYFIGRTNRVILGRIFRITATISILVTLSLFLVSLIADKFSSGIWSYLAYLIYLVSIILFYLAIRINKSLAV